ncbi:DinB family protein [Undibacterium sp. Ren11W]|uniref:DinB family protein n=1 Tax=Undibacterium sp. Ren11W TaxID=3413045 RepID=UPI003BF14604
MKPANLMTSLFKYKQWANQELFASMRELDVTQHQTERHSAIRILNHVYVVDSIFWANLHGLPHHYVATNTEQTPALDQLYAAVCKTDAAYLAYLEMLDSAGFDETMHFVFTDGGHGQMSRAEILMHVITHGGYHRGAVGRILSQLSIAAPRDIYTKFLHESEPGRRAG